ncbi:MAG: hypothetical protein EOO77_20110 [Oxalobacteraceae bacterium]|nr:MAG: hypothetical protein EOO77_20110 [Oxalobacteraceae bacterium]
MYGFSPAAFDYREAYEHGIYETLEGPWLIAWWDRYVAKIEADPKLVYEITQGGLATGWLMMSEQRYDERHRNRFHEADMYEIMADKMRQTIDKEIIDQLVADCNQQIVQAMRMPAHYLVTPNQPLSPTVLRAHEKTLLDFPAKSRVAGSLRTMNVLV